MTNKDIWLYLKARNNVGPEGELAITSFTVSPTTIMQGETVTLEVQVSGGKADYTYLFKGNGNRIAETTTSDTTFVKTWKPGSTGTYTLDAVVKDASSNPVSKTITLNVKSLNTDNSEEITETTYQQMLADIQEIQEQE